MIDLKTITDQDFDTTQAIRLLARQVAELTRAVERLQSQVDLAQPKKPTPKSELKEK